MTDLDAPKGGGGAHGRTAAAEVSAPAAAPAAKVSEVQGSLAEAGTAHAEQPDASQGAAEGTPCTAPPEAGAAVEASASAEDVGQHDQAAAAAAVEPQDEAAEAKETEAEVAARLARAEEFKREGNELFGGGQWEAASVKYNQALDEAPASASKQRAVYFANLAACNIKTQQYAAAVQSCTQAIALDGGYEKALMRRCEAFERLDELDHALADAKKLLELAPGNAWATAKVATLQPVVDERTEKLKTEMFGKLKDLGNTILGKFGLSTDNFKFDKDPNSGGYSIRFER
ncbi:hypothetical protein HXX76_013326 [Chlamydomonas incerta]|uniref:Tetratricopeptide repeat 1 n=1 Tax=Chlamydomonas incerta TaxID=51695 RepID=A0A835VU53_CHLIN|nr:hypothetical protein HXX76_013326 [Chlamydomonas incerta]|eukprot:KAG2425953.1 hypothetical protein HXX76_013326 [Chlamydomonas incerta]